MPSKPTIIKFQPERMARVRAQKIADFHSLGTNGASANEFAKLVFTQFSLVKPAMLFPALAALREYQVSNPFAMPGQNRPKPGQEQP